MINTWTSFPLFTSLIRLQEEDFWPFPIAIVIKQECMLNLKIRLELFPVVHICILSEKSKRTIFYFMEKMKYRNFEMNRQCFSQNDAQNEVERTHKLRLWKDSYHRSDETAKRQLKIFNFHPFNIFQRRIYQFDLWKPWM